MTIKQKYAMLFFWGMFFVLLFVLLFNIFVVKMNFIRKFKFQTELLNSKIQLYNNFDINFKQLENIIKNDSKDFLYTFSNEKYFSMYMEVHKFEEFMHKLLNSKSIPIEVLNVDVKTDFPIIFKKDAKLDVYFHMKVGDIIE
ncbi:hypothetical protein SU69_08820 [Thermosipho melanesiensis]|uniref:Sensor histidine kinase n=2 Tax=Thermosipho melanesiensis TaxID=46541 RepID=A6LNT3_THEM4|nr:hypothetical protein [Thermosipho melanesiensis]ABR31584.1 hypothetical protein Tmel_1745 [Thermosipho melanesiensis BI429]APT74949.1 hypothetical protein BW47_09195 [Thermosipho melanesiensis]OOC35320.1 hypothetical protein SU69_08820 [Thermosipho melanesiensis]OOC35538.1 hypothetical protein SU70_08830 [Thermosipho melanesiensis]OOC36575.1 hypothetical protein SU68_08885 [Thermosipho melanesiensis]